MMLDSKVPTYFLRGKFSDIVAGGWEVKRRQLHTAHLAKQATKAQRLNLVAMLLVLLLAFLNLACATRPPEKRPHEPRHQRPAWKRLSLSDRERPAPDTTAFSF